MRQLLLAAAALFALLAACSKEHRGMTDPLAIPGELPNLLALDARGLLFVRSLTAANEALGAAPAAGPLHELFTATLGFDAARLEEGRAAALGIVTLDDAGDDLALQPIVRGASDADLKEARRVKGWNQVKIGNYHALFPGKRVQMDSTTRTLLSELRPGDLALAYRLGADAAQNERHVRQLASLLHLTGEGGALGIPEGFVESVVAPALAKATVLQASIGREGEETRFQVSVKSAAPPLQGLTSDAARDAAFELAKALPREHSVLAVLGADLGIAMRTVGPLLTSVFGANPAPLRIAYSTYFLLHETLYTKLGAGGAFSLHGSENGMEEAFLARVPDAPGLLAEIEKVVRAPDFAEGGVKLDSVTTAPFEGCQALQFRLVFTPGDFSLPASAPAELTDMVRTAARLLYGDRGLQVLACAKGSTFVYLVNVSDADARRIVRDGVQGGGTLPELLTRAAESAAVKPQLLGVADLRGLLAGSVRMRGGDAKRAVPPGLRGGALPVGVWVRVESAGLTVGGAARLKESRELWRAATGG